MYDLPRARQAGLAALIVVLAAGCTTSQATNVGAIPVVDHQSFVGGCAGTTLTDADPPAWAQAGWTVVKGAPWPVPWATGTHGDFVAFLFATELVAGPSPRVDGSDNKVLWVTKDFPPLGNATIEGRPLGRSQPVVTIADGPSVVDLPQAGCWTFRPSWTAKGRPISSINLEVLPAGTPP